MGSDDAIMQRIGCLTGPTSLPSLSAPGVSQDRNTPSRKRLPINNLLGFNIYKNVQSAKYTVDVVNHSIMIIYSAEHVCKLCIFVRWLLTLHRTAVLSF